MGLLEGKICIVTGGAGSIGLATARLFLAEGARVMLADLVEDTLEAARHGLDPDRTATVVTDVTRGDSVRRCVEATVSRWGKIDVLLSNAGNFGAVAPIESYPEDVFDAVYAVHVKGALLMAKYAVPQMNEGGRHAQVGLMRCLAKELAPRRIRVNTIHPGPVDNSFQAAVEEQVGKIIGRDATRFFNEMIPLGRHGSPDEIARSVLYLASGQSSFTTGAMLMVDGGMGG